MSDFGSFRLGKQRLIEIRSMENFKEDVKQGYLPFEQVTRQIEKNHKYKVRYEELLEKIRISFKKRLSS